MLLIYFINSPLYYYHFPIRNLRHRDISVCADVPEGSLCWLGPIGSHIEVAGPDQEGVWSQQREQAPPFCQFRLLQEEE